MEGWELRKRRIDITDYKTRIDKLATMEDPKKRLTAAAEVLTELLGDIEVMDILVTECKFAAGLYQIAGAE